MWTFMLKVRIKQNQMTNIRLAFSLIYCYLRHSISVAFIETYVCSLQQKGGNHNYVPSYVLT